jgi:lipid A 3-O-deacylase
MKISPKDLAIALFAFSTASLMGFAPAMAQTEQGFPSGIWTLQDENASISTTRPTDRYYVNGFHVGWISNVGAVPAPIANLGHAVWGDGTQRISLGVTQQIYTPNDTQATNSPTNDEPYAGYLAATLSLIQDTAMTRSVLEADIGVIGRDAGAEIVQNGFHSIIGRSGTHGWAYQLPSEPAFDILVSRTWRFPLSQLGNGLEVDTLPQIAAKVGATQIYAEPAVIFRLGQGLDSDFGAPMISPGPSGSDAYQAMCPLSGMFSAASPASSWAMTSSCKARISRPAALWSRIEWWARAILASCSSGMAYASAIPRSSRQDGFMARPGASTNMVHSPSPRDFD